MEATLLLGQSPPPPELVLCWKQMVLGPITQQGQPAGLAGGSEPSAASALPTSCLADALNLQSQRFSNIPNKPRFLPLSKPPMQMRPLSVPPYLPQREIKHISPPLSCGLLYLRWAAFCSIISPGTAIKAGAQSALSISASPSHTMPGENWESKCSDEF